VEEFILPYAELDISKLRAELEVIILTAVVETVRACPSKLMKGEGRQLLLEDKSHALLRAQMNSRLEALHRYRARIETIGEALEGTAASENEREAASTPRKQGKKGAKVVAVNLSRCISGVLVELNVGKIGISNRAT
jgi:hypothetical protein